MINLDQPIIQFFRSYNQNKLESIFLKKFSWELLIRQARSAHLLGRVSLLLEEQKLFSRLAKKEQTHLQNALLVAQANERTVKWEVRQIQKVLSAEKIPVIFLKGSAYILLNLPAAKGRVFADVDIMVPKSDIGKAERSFVNNGWMPANIFDVYYQKYYRQWMHEIPPLRHKKRKTELDVHHTIIPPTSKLKPNTKFLWDEVQEISNLSGSFVLSPCTMILHSAAHLFHEGEFDKGLRDISDLDLLLNEYSKEDGFWSDLINRAKVLDLHRPLFYALRYTSILLKTSIPKHVFKEIKSFSPGRFEEKIMDFLFLRALMPNHPSCDNSWTGLARWLLYIRSHWLRMPMHLLIPHLLRKSWMRLTGKTEH